MTNVPLIFQPLIKYADFQGRARRTEFWLWVLLRIIIGGVLGAIFGSVVFSNFATLFANPHPDPQVFMQHYLSTMFTVMPIAQIINLGLLIPSLAVGVRRLHDICRSGWWLVMPVAVAIVSVIVMLVVFGVQIFQVAGHGDNMSDAEGVKFALGMVGGMFLCMIPVLIAEIVMLVFYVTEGQRGPNRFGPDPKGEALNDTP